MSVDANALERETLERKDRDELAKIVGALGGKATSRTRKADLVDQILDLTGVTARTGGDADHDDQPGEPAGEPAGSDPSDAGPGAADGGGADAGDRAPAEEAGAGSDRNRDRARPATGGRRSGPNPRGSGGGTRTGAAEGSGDEAGERNSGDSDDEDAGQTDASSPDRGATPEPADADGDDTGGKRRRRRGRGRDVGAGPEEYTGEPIPVEGTLDLRDDGYGFLRLDGLLPGRDDCYVSVKQVRQFGLRKGDRIAGGSRPAFRNEKNPAMLRIDTVNGVELEPGARRALFEEMRATFPTEQLVLELDDEPDELDMRALDLLAPIGKGSRVLLLAPPRTGKTTMLADIARSIEVNEPEVSVMVVLIDERPEEISEMESVVTNGTVHAAAFDAPPEDQVALVELAMARARRQAEAGEDVVVLFDGLTRLARAAHAASSGVGRTLGDLDVAAIHAAKRAFGAARNLGDAGSVTMVATAAHDTGSPADEAVAEAVVGAADTVVTLDGFAAARLAHPAIDVDNTTTRHPEYLVGDQGAAARDALRHALAELPDGTRADETRRLDGLLARLRDTGSNDELLATVAGVRSSRARS